MAVNGSSLGLLTVSNPGSSFSRTKLWRVPTVVRAVTFSQDVSSYLISRTLVIERDYDVGEFTNQNRCHKRWNTNNRGPLSGGCNKKK